MPSFPLYSVYVASKRYMLDFSRSLSVEYKGRGIDVQCQVRSMNSFFHFVKVGF